MCAGIESYACRKVGPLFLTGVRFMTGSCIGCTLNSPVMCLPKHLNIASHRHTILFVVQDASRFVGDGKGGIDFSPHDDRVVRVDRDIVHVLIEYP